MKILLDIIWRLKINKLLADPIYRLTGYVLVRYQDKETGKAFKYTVEPGKKFGLT